MHKHEQRQGTYAPTYDLVTAGSKVTANIQERKEQESKFDETMEQSEKLSQVYICDNDEKHVLEIVYYKEQCHVCDKLSNINTMYKCQVCKRNICNSCAAAIRIVTNVDKLKGFLSIEELDVDNCGADATEVFERVKCVYLYHARVRGC